MLFIVLCTIDSRKLVLDTTSYSLVEGGLCPLTLLHVHNGPKGDVASS